MLLRDSKPHTDPPCSEGCAWGQEPQNVKKNPTTETRYHKSASGRQTESYVQGQHMASEPTLITSLLPPTLIGCWNVSTICTKLEAIASHSKYAKVQYQ